MVLLVIGYWQLHDVQNSQHVIDSHQQQLITAQHAAVILNCQAGNAYRVSDEEGWAKFLSLALGPHPSLHALQVAEQLRTYIHGLDTPRDCSRL